MEREGGRQEECPVKQVESEKETGERRACSSIDKRAAGASLKIWFAKLSPRLVSSMYLYVAGHELVKLNPAPCPSHGVDAEMFVLLLINL